MKLGIIAALARNSVIGDKGRIPWDKIPEDMARFQRLTMGHPVIMGRRTAESLGGKPLKGRTNIVVTSRPEFQEGFLVAKSLGEACFLAESQGADLAWSIGGTRIYAESLPLADVMEITRLDKAYQGDTFFPLYDTSRWQEVDRIIRPTYQFRTYQRRKDG